MRTRLLFVVATAALLAPAAAFAQDNSGNAVGGAVGGAIIGGVVGGPVGAAIGAGVGGTVGAAVEPPPGVVTYVEREDIPSVDVRERVVIGKSLPDTVVLRPIPEHTEWRFAVVNHQRVIVDPQTRRVVKIIER